MSTRDITISVKGLPFIVTVLLRNPHFANQENRRFRVRIAGSKHDIDEVLSAGVLSEIDKRIKGGIEHLEDATEIPFDVPTGGAE